MIYIEKLDVTIFCFFQRVIYYVNLYVDGFKSCGQKLEETENTNPIICMVIKMVDPIKPNQDTHNHLSSIEVARIFIGENNSYSGVIE